MPEINMNNKWLSMWNDNYYGKSPQAKELEEVLKKNYQGHGYIPWATMVRMMYQQDADADIEVMSSLEEFAYGSNFVFTDIRELKIVKEGKETLNTIMSHFVKIKVTFMGKTHIETYPVQDSSYKAPKDFDSNMINKSIQRAKAKAISTITGLAFSLYESGDLQFEDDDVAVTKTAKKAPVTPKTEAPVTPKPETTKDTAVENKLDDTVKTLAEFILAKKPEKVLAQVNKSFKTSYDTELSTDDTLPVLMGKIARVKNPKLFSNSFMKMCEREGIV